MVSSPQALAFCGSLDIAIANGCLHDRSASLGHSDVRVTMRYTRAVENTKRVAVEAITLSARKNVLSSEPEPSLKRLLWIHSRMSSYPVTLKISSQADFVANLIPTTHLVVIVFDNTQISHFANDAPS